ncbi:MAG: pirin family protein [Rhodothermia bacterium]|nr:MAG: pirin family protein [Rhodothermia bacterium]
MQTVFHPGTERGIADHGWLKARHSFSFAGFFNPDRMNFGALRVLNDDVIAPEKGFGTHPHDNMEIVTIPQSGIVEHKDSMGHTQQLVPGEVQAMSAGTGILHSEYNGSSSEPLKLFQLWVLPKERNVEPRYDQRAFSEEGRKNRFQFVASPNGIDESLSINQDAFFSLGDFEVGDTGTYDIQLPPNGCYLFVIEGSVEIEGQTLGPRDAVGFWDAPSLDFHLNENTRLLCIEVPMI